MNEYGKVHAIYGDGKGKTTSSIGLAIRAAGYGLNVSFVQFMKDGNSSERAIFDSIQNIDYFCPGEHGWAYLGEGFKESQRDHALCCLEYVFDLPETTDMVVCDEILNVPLFGLNGDRPFDDHDIENMVKNKRTDLEMILTGLDCPKNLLGLVDYASNIESVNHPYQQGVKARRGIEY